MTITEFLTARLEEAEASEWKRIDDEVTNLRADGLPDTTRDDLLNMPESDHWRRPLADIAAKRSILSNARYAFEIAQDEAPRDPSVTDAHSLGYRLGQWHGYHTALRLLAQVYAEHPDFDESWKP